MKYPHCLAKLSCVLAFCASAAAHADGPVKIVIAFPPGGPVDFVARVVADGLSKQLDRNIIVDNRPGANGAISAQLVARAAADGDTLWLTSAGAVAINPSLYVALPYDMKRDFTPVTLVVNNVEVLVVEPSNPADTVSAFINNAKRSPKSTPVASSGVGSMPHLALELLAGATGANLLHIPYNGAAPAIAAVMGGQVAGFFGDIPGLIGQIKGGKLKPIGIAAPERHPSLPDVPTLDEQGIHGVVSNNWYALYAPLHTPAATIARLNAALATVLTSEPWKSKLIAAGAVPNPGTPGELAALADADTEKWRAIIRAHDIKGN